MIGAIKSGVLRKGDVVEIWQGDQFVASAQATVELICSRRADKRSIALMLGNIDQDLVKIGQTIRCASTK